MKRNRGKLVLNHESLRVLDVVTGGQAHPADPAVGALVTSRPPTCVSIHAFTGCPCCPGLNR
jgi:hypothetical protein